MKSSKSHPPPSHTHKRQTPPPPSPPPHLAVSAGTGQLCGAPVAPEGQGSGGQRFPVLLLLLLLAVVLVLGVQHQLEVAGGGPAVTQAAVPRPAGPHAAGARNCPSLGGQAGRR